MTRDGRLMEIYHVIPLLNAVIYTLGALCIKRATNDGIGPWRTTFFTNLILFLVAVPFWFFGEPIESWTLLWIPAAIGVAFFLGQLFGCLAIHKGDVSLVTPLFGTKTVIVALLASVVFGVAISGTVWVGAVMSAMAILLMRGETHAERARLLPSIYLGLACALFYAFTDVLMQVYGYRIGFHKIMAGTFSFVALWSLVLIPKFSASVSSISKRAWGWLAAGGGLLALQATGMAYVLSVYGKATVVNILYSSRGIWSVVLVWVIGHWFSNYEKKLGRNVMFRRLIGSILLIAAIVLVLKE